MTKGYVIKLLVFIHLITCEQIHGLTCKDCARVVSPDQCNATTICGHDEMCFTEEVIDQKEQQSFRLGCTNKARCPLFPKPNTVIGKREVSDPGPPRQCYQCCSRDGCNTALCHNDLSSTKSCKTSDGCDGKFVAFKDHCYLVAPGSSGWINARQDCQSIGADLPSINSQEENDFLAKELSAYKAYTLEGVWTAGVFDKYVNQWIWKDGASFNYTNWLPGSLLPTYSKYVDYYAYLTNPAFNSTYETAPWKISTRQYGPDFGVICKKPKLK